MFTDASNDVFPAESEAASIQVVAPTAAEMVGLVEGWVDLSDRRRDNIISALKRAAEICELPPEALMMDCRFLNERFYRREPAAFGMTGAGFGNIGTHLRYVLERIGQYAPRDRTHDSLPASWRALHDALPSRHRRASVIAFMRYCGLMGIEPCDVQPETIIPFEEWCKANILHKNITHLAYTTQSAWNKAVLDIRGWPQVRLERPKARCYYTVPFETYPPSFQQDVQAFIDRIAGRMKGRRFAAAGAVIGARSGRACVGSGKPATEQTIKTRTSQLKMAAAALVQSGRPPEAIRSLRDLVDPIEHADAIFTFFWERGGEKPGSHVAGMGELLRQIALYHCSPPAPGAEEIAGWARTVAPRQGQGMTAKNRHRLQALLRPKTRDDLLALPKDLLTEARATSDRRKAAWLMMRAVAIEILLICPLRLDNLRTLRIDQNLLRLDKHGKQITHITIPVDDVKNRVPIDWALPAESAELIQLWIEKYRPALAASGDTFLFPGRFAGAITKGGMSTAITRTVERRIGAKVHVHLFRHFAIAMFLEAYPGAYETARRILGHKSIKSTIDFYAGLEANSASEQFDEVILAARRSARRHRKGSPRRPGGRPPSPSKPKGK